MARFRFPWECGGPLPLGSAFTSLVRAASRTLRTVLVASVFLLVGDAVAAQEDDGGRQEGGEETERAKITAEDGLSTIEEIVVSARKRDEFLEDTPISVTALGAAELRESNVERLDDLSRLVPNLQIQRGTEGFSANIVIRGVGNPQQAAIAFDPGVGVYVDGVYLARAMGSLLDIVDVAQVEVLRGPQGTLFGKNTVGGALNITTTRPRDQLEAFALLRPGNRGTLFTQAMLNIPVVEDRLFVRASFSSNRDRGWSRNVDTGLWYNDVNSVAFLGSLRWLPTDNLTIDVTGTWSKAHSRGAGGQCVFVREAGLTPEDLPAACEESTPRTNSSNIPGLVTLPSYGAWATVALDLGSLGFVEDMALKSITSWREQKPRLRSDVDQTRSDALWRDSTGGTPLNGRAGDQRQVSQELQVSGSALEETVQFIAGVFGYWEKGTDGQVLDISFPGGFSSTTLNLRTIDNWNWALFTQATWDPLTWLSLTGGIRYTREKKGLLAQNFNVAVPDAPPSLDVDPEAIFDAVTPMATVATTLPEEYLDQSAVDHVMGYFSYARGFRGGGFNGVIDPSATGLDQFGPEYLDSFEVGLKTIAFDQRLTVNLSLFASKYRDIQVTTQVEIEDPGGTGLQIGQATTNAASAYNHGAEIEMTLLPIDGLLVQGSVGLQDPRYAEFASFSQVDAQPLDRAGQTFNNSPLVQTHLAVQYSLPVDLGGSVGDGWLTPRLEWDYRSSFHPTFPEITEGIQDGYNLLHARLSYSFFKDRAQVAVWGRNLTDKNYINAVTPVASSFGFIVRYYDAPRTFGGEISWSF